MSVQIESDLKEFLDRFDQKLDRLDQKIDQKIDKLSQDVDQKIGRLDQKIDKLSQDVTKLQVGQAEIKGEIKTLDTKVDGLDKRISNQEFTNRGVLVSLIIVILGGAAKFLGMLGNL
jgi:chromosome segregation ATPase